MITVISYQKTCKITFPFFRIKRTFRGEDKYYSMVIYTEYCNYFIIPSPFSFQSCTFVSLQCKSTSYLIEPTKRKSGMISLTSSFRETLLNYLLINTIFRSVCLLSSEILWRLHRSPCPLPIPQTPLRGCCSQCS